LYTTSAGEGGPEGGLSNVVQAFFLSPNFLYRSELGDNNTAGMITDLTDYELASALSYTLWDSAPDQTLMDLAAQGKLRDKATLLDQAQRMLGVVEKSKPALESFVQQWLHIEDLLTTQKDPTVYAMGTKEAAADFLQENQMFFDSVMFDPAGDRSFKTLFTASYGFVSSRTAPIYGIQGVTGNNLVRKDFDPTVRKGLLSLGSFMWEHAKADGTHPVERGRFFREEILCEGVSDPPPSVVIDPQFGDASLPARQRLAIHKKQVVCASCHALMDDLGLSMEDYDGIGRNHKDAMGQATDDRGNVVDLAGTFPLPSDMSDMKFKNFIDLIDQLSSKPDPYTCFASQLHDYATGRRPGENAECEQAMIANDFAKAGYKMDALVMSIVNSPSFMSRKN
jgi:hypothetical protein